MVIGKPLPFISNFIEVLNESIKISNPGCELSLLQRYWLSFCIMAIFITNSVCWAKFERASLGKYSLSALSWMFRHSKIPWELLLVMSVRVIIKRYGITKGVLGIDETDRKRSKSAEKIAYIHKLRDAVSNGIVTGQCIVFLLLITPTLTIPVGFAFHVSDPALTEWYKKKKEHKKSGTCCPKKPARNKSYPTKQEIALSLLIRFKEAHPEIKISCVIADALYCSGWFFEKISAVFGGMQVISQLKSNQKVFFKNKEISVTEYFDRYAGVSQKIRIRGDKEIRYMFTAIRK